MKKSRFSDSQILAILKQHEARVPVAELSREHNVSTALIYIQPGKPTQNAYIERFNRTARHEWLDLHEFISVAHAQPLATQWLWQYNNERPNTAIGGIPPTQLLQAA
jgi:transposase InsO family protein